eukprot:TRINITY_DN1242_c0_g2_i1.p1 TRINITY_DN1242_c0_g2~~TRINITY_DN1242_c0_g2_i1.p1  ORF type:complete len:312 (+),score=51.47 TRINITY_DN1242_c0_g2_i1:23-937(+)
MSQAIIITSPKYLFLNKKLNKRIPSLINPERKCFISCSNNFNFENKGGVSSKSFYSNKLQNGLIITGITLGVVSTGNFFIPNYSYAEEDANLSPYERRLREKEKRMELLKSYKEKAIEKAAGETQPEESEAASNVFSGFKSTIEEAPSVKVSPPAFSFSQPSPTQEKPVTPSIPAPPPVQFESPFKDFKELTKVQEVQKEEKTPVVEVKKSELSIPKKEETKTTYNLSKKPQTATEAKAEASQKSKKRKGPLPLFLAQLIVLISFVGLGLAFTRYEKITSKVIDQAGEKIGELYEKVEEKLIGI